MFSSKPRSWDLDISTRNPLLVVSKLVPSQKPVRGNNPRPHVYPKSLKSVQQNPLTSQANLRFSEMQRLAGKPEELSNLKKRLATVEEERDRARDELEEMKKLAEDANLRLIDTSMTNGKVADVFTELNSVVEALSKSNHELKIKELAIGSLQVELENARKGLNAKLGKMEEELNAVKSSEACTLALFTESKRRIQELNAELEKRKESEIKVLESFDKQTKQLEETQVLLRESKLEIASLRAKLQKLKGSSQQDGFKRTKSDVKQESLICVKMNEKDGEFKDWDPVEEIKLLKNELKLAIEAEENSKKAMDDLALALKEVAMEANNAKEKLVKTQEELEHFKGEAEESKEIVKSMEGKNKPLIEEARKEAERYKNIAERLRIEAEESLLAWNGKETEFVNCIKRAEEEKASALEENAKLLDLLEAAEKRNKASKHENQNLRDIMKQALNEANVAKEAAGIAKAENSQLKDIIAEKDDAIMFITRENEILKFSEAAALENMNELKRFVSETSSGKDVKAECSKDHDYYKHKPPTPTELKEPKHGKKLSHTFSLNLKELIVHKRHKEPSDDQNKAIVDKNNPEGDEDDLSDDPDPLKGSIFDADAADSPVAPVHRHKKSSSAFEGFGGETFFNPDDYDHPDAGYTDDLEQERNYRKKSPLFRRFGEIITRRSFHKKEPSIGGETHKKEPTIVGETHKKEPSIGGEAHKKESSSIVE